MRSNWNAPPKVFAVACTLGIVGHPSDGLARLGAPSTDGAERQSETSATGDARRAAEEAAQLRTLGEARFVAGEFQPAIAAFERAHQLSPDPTDLFNLGVIHEEAGEYELALTYCEKFIEQDGLAFEELRAAAEHIKVLRVLVAAKETHASPRSDPGQPAPAKVPPPTPRDVEPEPGPASASIDDGASGPIGRPLIQAGTTLAAIGVAIGIGGGVGFGLAARRQADTVQELGDGLNPSRLTLAEAEDADALGQDYETLQIASIATGAGLLVLGVGLLAGGVVRRKRARSGARARLDFIQPVLTANEVALAAGWRY